MIRLCFVCTACVCLVFSVSARAQSSDPEEQFNRAVELAKEDEYGKAIKVCLDVLDELPESERSRVHKLLGYAHKKLEMLPESWHHLTIYLESSGRDDTTAGGWLQEVEAALKMTHVKVTLTCTPSGARLSLPASQSSSVPVSPLCPLSWWFKPGKHAVKAIAPDYKPRAVEIDVRERGDSGMRQIRLAALVPNRPPDGIETAPGNTGTTVAKPAEPKKPSRGLEWAFIGSGLALGVTGGIIHGIGYSTNDGLHDKYLNTEDYPNAEQAQTLYDDAREEEVRPKEIAAYVLYGVGGAAVLAGIVTWAVRKPEGGEADASRLTLSPLLTSGRGAGALVTFEF